MTNNELKDLYNESSYLKIQPKRELIIKGIVTDFIINIKQQYSDKSNTALMTIIKSKLRYGASHSDSFYAYLTNRMLNIGVFMPESLIYEYRKLYNELSFDYLDSIVDLYFIELVQKENLLSFTRTGLGLGYNKKPSTTGSEENNDTLNKSIISSKYSKYIIIGATALFLLLILRK